MYSDQVFVSSEMRHRSIFGQGCTRSLDIERRSLHMGSRSLHLDMVVIVCYIIVICVRGSAS